MMKRQLRWLTLSLALLLIGCADPSTDEPGPPNPTLPPGQWIQKSPDLSPSARILHAMAYDTDNQQVILFGGRSSAGASGDTWIYNPSNNTWNEQILQGSPPPPAAAHAMVYDPVNKRVILFGGVDPTGIHLDNDAWAYNVEANSWTNLNLNPADSPSPRSLTAMVYVPDKMQVILFGGETEEGLSDETWAFNDTWTKLTLNPSPSPRFKHAMAYDAMNQQVILFGGEIDLGEKNSETWAYDVNNNTWSELSPANPPSARLGHAMVYDTINERIMMFGGFATGSSFPNGGTWVFDYSTKQWSQLFPPAPVPQGRFLHAMAYNIDTGETILFGGAWEGCGGSDCDVRSEFYQNDTWIYTNR